MSRHTHLQWASVAFAVLWTTGMALWSDAGSMPLPVLAVCGAIAGLGWYYIMKRFQNGLLVRDR